MRFGILRVHRILRRPRVRVTTIDPTGRPGLIRYSFRDTARTRSVLANPDPRFAITQRTSWLQFPLLLGWVSLHRLLQTHQVAQSIAHFGALVDIRPIQERLRRRACLAHLSEQPITWTRLSVVAVLAYRQASGATRASRPRPATGLGDATVA